MKIIAVTACTAGIAHTYIVAEKLQQAAEEMGHWCKVETQGSAGVQNEPTAQEIQEADVAIRGQERFKDKRIVDIPIALAMKQPKSLIATIEKKLAAK